MRGFTLLSLSLLLLLSLLFVFLTAVYNDNAWAVGFHSVRITTPKNLRFTSPSGQRYRVKSSTFRTRCNARYCYFRAANYRLRVSRSQIQIHNEERNYNPTYFSVHRTQTEDNSSELSGGGSSYTGSSYTGSSYTGSSYTSYTNDYANNHSRYVNRRQRADGSSKHNGSSKHIGCYQRLGNQYTSTYCPNRRSLSSIRGCSGSGTKSKADSLGWCARYVRFIFK